PVSSDPVFSLAIRDLADLRSFPTRRSSDLPDVSVREESARTFTGVNRALGELLGPSGLCLLESADPSGDPQCPKRHHGHPDGKRAESGEQDRKSTRLNSSHVSSSYAVFCLKKKTPVAAR